MVLLVIKMYFARSCDQRRRDVSVSAWLGASGGVGKALSMQIEIELSGYIMLYLALCLRGFVASWSDELLASGVVG